MSDPPIPTDPTCSSNSDCDKYKDVAGYTDPVCGTLTYEAAGQSASIKMCVPKESCGQSQKYMGVSASVSCGANLGMILGIVGGVVALLVIVGVVYKKSKK